MKRPSLLATGCVAALVLLAVGVDAQAQGGPRGGGGGFQGGPPPGGGFRGGPAPGGGAYYGRRPGHAHYPRGGGSVYLGVYGPGYWWGPGYWPGYWWGSGYWAPRHGYAYPPYYDGYPPAYVAPAPPVYIERDAPPQPAAPVWWYWCAEANAYYPYVKECAGGWQRVPPQPVPPERQ